MGETSSESRDKVDDEDLVLVGWAFTSSVSERLSHSVSDPDESALYLNDKWTYVDFSWLIFCVQFFSVTSRPSLATNMVRPSDKVPSVSGNMFSMACRSPCLRRIISRILLFTKPAYRPGLH